jgi:hypothetical protein
MERTMAGNKLSPSIGPVKWRNGVVARFQFNAQRCRNEAERISDPEERAYTLDLAELWEQLADAARFSQIGAGDRRGGLCKRARKGLG